MSEWSNDEEAVARPGICRILARDGRCCTNKSPTVGIGLKCFVGINIYLQYQQLDIHYGLGVFMHSHIMATVIISRLLVCLQFYRFGSVQDM